MMYVDNLTAVEIVAIAYSEAAEWADDVLINEAFEEHATDLAGHFVAFMQKHIFKFDIVQLEQCGHDLWLTRQGHGVGFWDRSDDFYDSKAQRDALNDYAENLGQYDDYELIPGSERWENEQAAFEEVRERVGGES